LAIENPLARSGTEKGPKKNLAGFHSEQSYVKSAILPDSTVSGDICEERNAKVNKTIKTHVEWTVADCSHVEISLFSFSSGRRGSEEEEKIIARSEEFRRCFLLILCSSQLGRARQSCLFFAAATAAAEGKERKEDSLSEPHRAASARRYIEDIKVTKTIKTLQVWTVADGGLLERGKCKNFLSKDYSSAFP
jgi:hypothetical protein